MRYRRLIGYACRFQTFRHLKEQFNNCSCNIGWWKELNRQSWKTPGLHFAQEYGYKHTKTLVGRKMDTQYSFHLSNLNSGHFIDHFRIVSIRPGWAHSQRRVGVNITTPPPLTVMWMNFDSPNFPSFCSLSAIISFQTCSNKCILYVLSFHKCIKIKYKMVNMYGVFRD